MEQVRGGPAGRRWWRWRWNDWQTHLHFNDGSQFGIRRVLIRARLHPVVQCNLRKSLSRHFDCFPTGVEHVNRWRCSFVIAALNVITTWVLKSRVKYNRTHRLTNKGSLWWVSLWMSWLQRLIPVGSLTSWLRVHVSFNHTNFSTYDSLTISSHLKHKSIKLIRDNRVLS